MSAEVVKRKDIPWWLSIYYLFTGLSYIVLSTIIIALPKENETLLFDLLTVILLFLGVSRVLYGIFRSDSSLVLRIPKTIVGIAIIVLSGIDFYFRETNSARIILLAVGILLLGAVRIAVGIIDKSEEKWFRVMLVIIGSISAVISILFLIFSGWPLSIYIILLAVAFILQGFTKINYALRVFEKK